MAERDEVDDAITISDDNSFIDSDTHTNKLGDVRDEAPADAPNNDSGAGRLKG